MKFFQIKKFLGSTVEDAVSYLKNELPEGARELFIGLQKLNFVDNFNGFIYEGDINAAQTVTITNPLGQIPIHRVVLRARPLAAGTVILDDSLTAWTPELVYLRNAGAANGHFVVYFIR